jgi:uncharacterized protein (TIGR02145 family)
MNPIAVQSAKKNAPINKTITTSKNNKVIDDINICDGISQITDSRDTNNQIYTTVAIGAQCWLSRNLNIGIRINGSKRHTDNAKIEKYCYNDDEAICNTDGGLYSWDEAMQFARNDNVQGICPTGWHVPSDGDWVMFESYLAEIEQEDCSGSRIGFGCAPAGKKLEPKSLCVENHEQADCGTSGFNAVYAGDRNDYSSELFTYRGETALFWSSTQYNTSSAWERHIYAKWQDGINRGIYNKNNAFSIRCIKNKK